MVLYLFVDTAPGCREAQAVFYVTRESVTRPPCLSSVESARSMRDPCLVAFAFGKMGAARSPQQLLLPIKLPNRLSYRNAKEKCPARPPRTYAQHRGCSSVLTCLILPKGVGEGSISGFARLISHTLISN